MDGFKAVAGMCKVQTSAFLGNLGIFRPFLAVLYHALHIFDLCRADQGCATRGKGWNDVPEHCEWFQNCCRNVHG